MYLQTRHTTYTHTHTQHNSSSVFLLMIIFHFKSPTNHYIIDKEAVVSCRFFFYSHSTSLFLFSHCNVSFEARKMSRVLHGWVKKRFNVNMFNSLMMYQIHIVKIPWWKGNKNWVVFCIKHNIQCILSKTLTRMEIKNKPPLIVWQLFIINRFFIGNSNTHKILL